MARTYLPLDGIKVLSFETAFALPAGTRALHDLGADVVRVASPGGNAFGRYVSVTDGVFHGKPCISIDLTHADGRQIAVDLALEADVVCNNFRPSVLEKYGLGAATLRGLKPELIVLQLSGYGTPGPWSNYPAYGPSTEAAGGMNKLMVEEEERPFRLQTGVFSDQLSGRHAAFAITSALLKRHETGVGASIDLSMTECITHLIGEEVVAASMNGGELTEWQRQRRRHPNRDAEFAPQGIYPCRGDDEWVAIAITSEKTWRALAGLVEGLDASADVAARRADHDAIDARIGAWTEPLAKDDVMHRLQALGIAASAVRTVRDSATDPQFSARQSLQMVQHKKPLLGYDAHPHPPLPWRVLGRLRRRLTDFRNSGQDNATVLARWLDYPRRRVNQLERNGALSRSDQLDMSVRQPTTYHDPDFARIVGLPGEK